MYILMKCSIFSTGITRTPRGPGKRKHEEGSVLMLTRERKPGRLWRRKVSLVNQTQGTRGHNYHCNSCPSAQAMRNLKVRKRRKLNRVMKKPLRCKGPLVPESLTKNKHIFLNHINPLSMARTAQNKYTCLLKQWVAEGILYLCVLARLIPYFYLQA